MLAANCRPGRFLLALLFLFVLVTPTLAAPVKLPDGSEVKQVDFERHVAGLIGRLGCNAGACHGSFQGKGGLYLSLFGYSPEKDHRAFTREGMSRRISVANPDASLLLLKGSGQVAHGGGKRFDKDSWQYNILREWIANGAQWEKGSGDVVRMEVTPGEHLFARQGEVHRFRVFVTFANGLREDMTFFSDYRVNDDYVAELTAASEVKSLRPGDTAVVISYRGHVQGVRALVPVPVDKDFVYPKVAEVNFIDRLIQAKLRRLNIVPSDPSSDTEFLRRLHIDTIGSLPPPDEIRDFVADQSPDKRTKKIEELLKYPMHAALWATKFSDITGNNIDAMEQPPQLRIKRSKMWHDWFRQRVADNVPYDEIVKGVLTATSREGLPPEEWVKQALNLEQQARVGFDSDYAKRASLDLFWRRNQFTIEQMAEHTAAAFMGVRLECAQCHKHPHDRWTQVDYRSYANLFTGIKFNVSPETQSMITKVQAEQRKAQQEELAAVDKEFAERKKEAEAKADQENAERRKEGEAKIDRDNADRRKAVEVKNANEPEDKRKAALAAIDKENEARKKKELTLLDQTLATRKRTALAPIEREIATKRAAVQAKFQQGQQTQLREVFVSNQQTKPLLHPETNASLKPKALGGPEIEPVGDPRVPLFDWMRSAENPYFARSFVNRVWAHYFGLGLVEPVDNLSVGNPSSNEPLLDALAKDFAANKYDIRHLERTILQSRTYQQSARPNATNRHDRNSYARSYPRRLMAEVVIDVLNSALGTTENFGPEAPPNCRAIEFAPNRTQNQTLANVFRIFGRPPRTSTCDCERVMEPGLPETLFLMTDPNVLTKITGGRLKQLLSEKKSDEEVLDEVFLATQSRLPTEKEKTRALAHVKEKGNRQAGFVDVVWALINTREFILNH